MIQLNLLPDLKKQFLRAQKQRNIVISVCVIVSLACVGILVALGATLGGQALIKSNTTKDIAKQKTTLLGTPNLNAYLTLQNQLSQLDGLKNNQLIYSRLFAYLQQLNPTAPNNMQLSSVKLGADASSTSTSTADTETGTTVTMDGKTTNFASLNTIKTTLISAQITYAKGKDGKAQTEPLFSTVNVTSAGLSQSDSGGSVSFTLSVTFNVAAFAPDSTGIKLTIPSSTTSDSDKAAPQDVFTDNPSDVKSDQNSSTGTSTDSTATDQTKTQTNQEGE
ncbi:MAG: hypothetical protein LBM73_01080 [Candidatus Nomurabacteria bacterium]|jgi:hypothetical protein|nr:hypothetical protein [Candidatus Nomurabacteria bacterium]